MSSVGDTRPKPSDVAAAVHVPAQRPAEPVRPRVVGGGQRPARPVRRVGTPEPARARQRLQGPDRQAHLHQGLWRRHRAPVHQEQRLGAPQQPRRRPRRARRRRDQAAPQAQRGDAMAQADRACRRRRRRRRRGAPSRPQSSTRRRRRRPQQRRPRRRGAVPHGAAVHAARQRRQGAAGRHGCAEGVPARRAAPHAEPSAWRNPRPAARQRTSPAAAPALRRGAGDRLGVGGVWDVQAVHGL